MLLAALVAVLHGAVVALLLTGSLLALRWPRVLWVHVPVTLTVLVLYLTGSGCPLTTWELALRVAAGEPRYRGGFLGHYITEPMGIPIEATSTQLGIYAIAFSVNAVGYGLLISRHLRARAGTSTAARSRARRVQGSTPVTAQPAQQARPAS